MTIKPGDDLPEGFVESLTPSQARQLMQRLEEVWRGLPALDTTPDITGGVVITEVKKFFTDDKLLVTGKDYGKSIRISAQLDAEEVSGDTLAVIAALLDNAIQSVADARTDINRLMDNFKVT